MAQIFHQAAPGVPPPYTHNHSKPSWDYSRPVRAMISPSYLQYWQDHGNTSSFPRRSGPCELHRHDGTDTGRLQHHQQQNWAERTNNIWLLLLIDRLDQFLTLRWNQFLTACCSKIKTFPITLKYTANIFIKPQNWVYVNSRMERTEWKSEGKQEDVGCWIQSSRC